MFTTSASSESARTGKANRLTRLGASVGALALGTGVVLFTPVSATAADQAQSFGEGQFLSGSVLGTDLSNIAAVDSAQARNDGTQSTQTQKNPLSATVLNSIHVGNGSTLAIPLGSFLQLGAASQFAQAARGGSSLAASGAVTDGGGLTAGNEKSAPPADATFNLSALLGDQIGSNISDLTLTTSDVAAQATGNLDKASGDYTLADLKLSFSSPAIANLTQKVDGALQQAQSSLDKLVGKNGQLVSGVNGLVQKLDPALNLLGANANVTATIDTGDLQSLVQSILDGKYGNGAVAFDLQTGKVTVDLAKLLGSNINDLPPGTELLNDPIVNQMLNGITSTISTIADQVVNKVKDNLHNAAVDIHADATANVAQAPIVQQVCKTVQKIVQVPVTVPGTGSTTDTGTGGLLGGVLGGLGGVLSPGGSTSGAVNGITQLVNQTVNQLVCTDQSTAVAPLGTGVNLDIHGTVDQLINGSGATATAKLTLPGGAATTISANTLIDGVGTTLANQLFGSDSTVTDLVNALNTGLVQPAVDGLTGPSGVSVGNVLTGLVSAKVNLQETHLASAKGTAVASGSEFTETALRVSVLSGVGGSSLATVNLAQATVGPNITTVVTPPTDGNPGGPGTSGNPGTTAASISRLATTGVGIAALVAAVLALLAAGAYLVRESYRRNHPAQIG